MTGEAPALTVVFAVKNGLGFGHLRRASLLAREIKERAKVRPLIISQATSTVLFEDSGLHVLNLPRLNRLSSSLAEDAYLEILDAVLGRLSPTVVVEDTYPDPRLRDLDALLGVRRLLVARRLDAISFEQMIDEGAFRGIDRLLLCQTEAEFLTERHSLATRRMIETSGLVTFMGPVWRRTSPAERAAARRRYARPDQRLVVVTVGAGGDKYLDAFAHRLTTSIVAAAREIGGLGRSWTMTVVTGPYGPAGQGSSLPEGVTRTTWEPELPALLAAADVVVLRPGSNALLEALDGPARLVLVPDRSYREGLPEYSERVAAAHGAFVCAPQAQELTAALRQALDGEPTPPAYPEGPAGTRVAAAIEEAAAAGTQRHRRIPLGLLAGGTQPISSADVAELGLPPSLIDAVTVGSASQSQVSPAAVFLDDVPRADVDPHQMLARTGSVLLVPTPQLHEHVALWLRHRGLDPGLHVTTVSTFRIRKNCRPRLTAWLTRTLRQHAFPAGILLVVDPACDTWHDELRDLPAVLEALGTEPVPLTQIAQNLARQALQGGRDAP